MLTRTRNETQLQQVMSLTSEDNKGAAGAGGGAAGASQAPRLQAGGYAVWRPSMDVFLQRAGAEGVHKKESTAEQWIQLSKQVSEWADEALAEALALVAPSGAPAPSQAGSSAASSPTMSGKEASPPTDKVMAARKLVSAMVERSTKVYGIIFSSLPEELRSQVAHVPQGWAYGLWHWLETKFQSTEEDNVGAMLSEWTQLRQAEQETFDAYRARVDKLATLLERAKEKQSARMYAYTLLDKLLPRYKPAVLALKAGGQMKDAEMVAWDTVTAFINSHERSEQRIGASGDDATVMAAYGSGASYSKAVGSAGARSSDHMHRSEPRSDRDRRGPGRDDMNDGKCFNCNKPGHIARYCPDPLKARSRGRDPIHEKAASQAAEALPRQTQAQGKQARSAMASSEQVSCILSTNPFTPLSDGDDEDSDVSPEDASWTTAGSSAGQSSATAQVKMASAPAAKTKANLKPSTPAEKRLHMWGVDSMASTHVSGDALQFVKLHPSSAPLNVMVADGSVVTATMCGTVSLRVPNRHGVLVTINVDNVYYHKKFSANLLSWGKLREQGWEMHSTRASSFVRSPAGNQFALRTMDRVSVLAAQVEPPAPEIRAQVYRVGADEFTEKDVDKLVRMHERFGHVGFDRMVATVKANSTLGAQATIDVSRATLAEARRRVLECKACTLGKGTRTAFGHRGLDKGSAPGEVLHMDTFFIPRQDGDRSWMEYGLVVTDPFSEYRWFRRLDSKDEAAPRVIDILRIVQTQTVRKVKRLYADGGTEFINQTLRAFCHNHGIELHFPPARTPQLNAVAERSVRTVKDIVRTTMLHGGTQTRFWAHAAEHATYVWNRLEIATATGVTPFEAMYQRKPSAQHWGVFGCDAYAHVPKERRGVFEPKMEACIYLGHDHVQNCAVVYVLSSRKVEKRRDVEYRETSFAHAAALGRGDEAVREILDSGVEAALQGGMESSSESEPERHEVERIIGKRLHDGITEYLIQWVGYEEATWEPAAIVDQADELVAEFEQQAARAAAAAVAGPDAASASQPAPPADASRAAGASPPQHEEKAPGLVPARSTSDSEVVSPAALRTRSSQRLRGFQPDGSPIATAQVHMATCAIRGLQLDEERSDVAVVMNAVAAGIAALERQTPNTYREAMASPEAAKWKAALDKEMRSCTEQHVWTLVRRDQLPRGANVLPCKEVFKVKLDEHGEVAEYKARFTPKGFRQKHGVDFFDTFARTGQYKTLRVALSLVAKWDHELAQFDVPTAFLNADVEEDIYMELPEGYEQAGMVCKLHKSLYGLKQAPRNWDKLVHTFITTDMAFKATVSDPSLYSKRSRSGRLMLIYRFVDDMLGSYHADDLAEFQQSVKLLQDRFRIKQMTSATWMLGMRIARDRKARTITLSQELYVTKALEKFGLQQCRVVSTPEQVGAAHESGPGLDERAEQQRYMEITGTLMYAAISTRPDIAHAVHYLASHMQAPTQRHMLAAERVLRYLAGTKEVGLVFGSRNGELVGDSRGRRAQVQVDVCAFADADWANDKGDRRSISGWVAKLNGDPVSWSSKKQRVVALSTCEAELYAESAAIQEVLWLRGLMEELGLHTQTGSTVYGDNQSAIAVSLNGVKGERTKHVDVKYHFVTETVERGEVKLRWVPTKEQQADIFTKALAEPVFRLLRQQLMTC